MARYLLGAPVRISGTFRDAATGALVTPTTVVLTVQKPDLTQQAYSSPTADGVGLYHQDVPTADLPQLGQYLYKWASTGPGAGVIDGSFDVADPFEPAIISLADTKQQLNITATTSDDELQTFIDATTRVVEGYVGPVGRQTFTERVWPVGDSLVLARRPVLSVASVVAVLATGVTYNPADLLIDSAAGVVTHRTGMGFMGQLTVTYAAGRAVIPANINLAARVILQHLWSTQRGGATRPGMGGGPDAMDQQLILAGFAIPRRAVELLAPDAQPGFA